MAKIKTPRYRLMVAKLVKSNVKNLCRNMTAGTHLLNKPTLLPIPIYHPLCFTSTESQAKKPADSATQKNALPTEVPLV